jgi:hypothetical protein
VVLAFVAMTLALGTAQAYRDAREGPSEAAGRQVIDVLRREGITHVYSGYLDCNRLTFLSGEQMTCAVLSNDLAGGLRPGFDRYAPYRTEVQADRRATYVFRTGDGRNSVLARSSCRWQGRWRVAGYEIWEPADPCPIPPTGAR